MNPENNSPNAPADLSRKDFLRAAGLTALAGALPAAPTLAAPTLAAPTLAAAPADPPTLPVAILVRGGLPPESVAAIAALGPQTARLIVAADDAAWRSALPNADALFGGFSPDDLRLAKRLRWIQYAAAGVEGVLTPELVASPIVLTNGKGCYGPAIAEHVFALLFALTRNVARQARQMRDKKWGGNGGLIEVRGMTMGILGFGGIGRETARRAQALGLHVVACDVQPLRPEQVGGLAETIYPVDGGGLEKMLTQSDIVVSAVPLTKKSAGMLGPAQFAQMKPGEYLINVSRGKIVQTPALVEALRAGKLAGAGLDVTDPEPLPEDSPLWAMDNVVITSHTAGQSQFTQTRVQAVFVENVRRFALGLPLLNMVDKQAGY